MVCRHGGVIAECALVSRGLEAVVLEYGLKLAIREDPAFKALATGFVQIFCLILAAEAHDGRAQFVVDLFGLVRTLGIEHLRYVFPAVRRYA